MKHGLIFGPAGSGKTNLKRLLTDKPPPPQRDSTPCMEKTVRIRPVSNKESTNLSTVSRVAESLKKMTTTEPISGSYLSSKYFDELSDSVDKAINELVDKAIDEVIASVASGVAEELKPATQGTDQLSSSDQQEGELFESNWVYVTDCGGQPQFHDISPLLFNSMALIAMHSIDELSSFPSDEYYNKPRYVQRKDTDPDDEHTKMLIGSGSITAKGLKV